MTWSRDRNVPRGLVVTLESDNRVFRRVDLPCMIDVIEVSVLLIVFRYKSVEYEYI